MCEEDDEGIENILDSDELGEKVEQTFGLLCADAKLVANKSSRDRAGWDYNINARIDLKSRRMLDSRPNPLACVMQVKGMWAGNDRIKVRLSSVEQLAKDPKPAFICALKIKEDLSLHRIYLIHLRGELLGRVLAKLRQQEAENSRSINHIYIDFYAVRDGSEIEPNGQALRRALEDACGNNSNLYVLEKSEELKSLGFEKNAFHISTTLKSVDPNDVRDIFLGKKEEIEATIESIVETRFGIPLERLLSPSIGTLRFQLLPKFSGEVTLRATNPRMATTFRVDIYVPPEMKGISFDNVIRLKNDNFDFIVSDRNLSFEGIAFSKYERREKLEVWLNLLKCYAILSSGSCVFEVRIKGRIAFRGSINDQNIMKNHEAFSREFEFAQQLSWVLSQIGAESVLEITYSELIQTRDTVTLLKGLLDEKEDPGQVSFELELLDSLTLDEKTSARLNSFVPFGDQFVLWAVLMDMDVQTVERKALLRSRTITLTDICLVTPDEYENYIAMNKQALDVMIVMSKNIHGDDTDLSLINWIKSAESSEL